MSNQIDWRNAAFISASRATQTDAENAFDNRVLAGDLEAANCAFVPVSGSYAGKREQSYMVALPAEGSHEECVKRLQKVGACWGQESVLFVVQGSAELWFTAREAFEHIGTMKQIWPADREALLRDHTALPDGSYLIVE